jgi:hypothetical protein
MAVDQTAYIIMTLTELILRYGPDAALKIIAAWTPENPTVEDWNSLRVKDPEEYFTTS